ncbi:MAG: hypothetical protein H6978_04330 [Gammaproteobacteria bacterium]|nr:hypothetical protein [Gammaproteobacteria bacterium]
MSSPLMFDALMLWIRHTAALWLLSAVAASVLAAESVSDCPEGEDLVAARARQLESLQHRALEIRAVLDGGSVATPLTGLFTIDLRDQDAIQRRVDELNAYLAGQRQEPDSLGACGPAAPETDEARRTLAQARLEFLTLAPERRAVLVNLQEAAQSQEETSRALAQERRATEAAGIAASEAQSDAEEAASTAESADVRQLAAQRAVVEAQRKQVAETRTMLLTEVEALLEQYRSRAQQLSTLASQDIEGLSQGTSIQSYREATSLWEVMARSVLNDARPDGPDLPREPELTAAQVARFSPLEQYAELEQAMNSLRDEQRDLVIAYNERLTQIAEMEFSLLTEAGRLRAAFLRAARRLEAPLFELLGADVLRQMALEIRVVPYRWTTMATRRIEHVQAMLRLGSVQEAMALGRAVGGVIGVISIIPILIVLSRLLERWLASVRASLLRAKSGGLSRAAAMWIRRLTPFISLALVWLFIDLLPPLLPGLQLEWVATLLPVARYVVFYLIGVRLLRELFAGASFGQRSVSARAALQAAERALAGLARYALITATLIYVFETLVGRLLVRGLLVEMSLFGGLLLAMFMAWRSRRFIAATAERQASERMARTIQWLCRGWVAPFGALASVGLLAWSAVAGQLRETGGNFEFAKRISAWMFLRRIRGKDVDAIVVRSPELPQDYREAFDLYHPPVPDVRVDPHTGDLEALFKAVDQWQVSGEFGGGIAICGYKGAGKSTLLARLAERGGDLRVITGTVAGKCTTAAQAASFFSGLLGLDLTRGAAALAEAQEIPRTLVLLDDAHNLFLRQRGGFEGFRYFLSLLNVNHPDLFWCAAFNQYPWAYLQDVFARELPFRSVRLLQPWGDEDIEELITRRHSRTRYRLRFDRVIMATDATAGEYIESRFFRLLWEQSRGIPRAALALWLKSLTFDDRRTMKVSLPDLSNVEQLADIPQEAMFIFAALVRHENLTAAEAQAVTGLAQALVRYAFARGREIGLVERGDDRRYRIAPSWSTAVNGFLKDRNLIYE